MTIGRVGVGLSDLIVVLVLLVGGGVMASNSHVHVAFKAGPDVSTFVPNVMV